MAGKISQLIELTTPADADELEIRDITEAAGTDAQNKRIKVQNLIKQLGSPKWIIYIDGSNIKALNTVTGSVQFINTDFSTLLLAVIATFPPGTSGAGDAGGWIHIKEGVYIVNTRILIDSTNGIMITGEGHGVSVQAGTTVLKQGNSQNLTEIIRVSSKNCIFRDFYIDGNRANNTTTVGMFFTSEDGSMENMGIVDCPSHGVSVASAHAAYFKNVFSETNGGRGFNITNSWGCTFINCYAAAGNVSDSFRIGGDARRNSFLGCHAQDDNDDAFLLDASSTTDSADNTYIGNVIHSENPGNGKHGFHLFGAKRNIFIGNIIRRWNQETNNTFDGFLLESTGGKDSTDNVFIANVISSDAANKPRRGFTEIDANQNRNIYRENVVLDEQTAKYLIQGPLSILDGLTPENSSTPITDTQDTIINANSRAYGLVTLPTDFDFYVITGIEWKNGATINGSVRSGIDLLNADPITLAATQHMASGRQILQTPASSIQRNSAIVSQRIPGGSVLGVYIVSSSATATFRSDPVGGASNPIRRAITFASTELIDTVSFSGSTERFFIKLYFKGIK